ncbi:unnamed protein product [Diatraea saccharalis]|uniref:Glucose-methanol-choline oxidoreductase N-terminal domain-containing protein n=1 Tax=Diatraea saccharalis TaxID=40085 RepID=A0A9N9WFY2_9NEOP|nr:unnamed protein product [Diatraea saccharalis]
MGTSEDWGYKTEPQYEACRGYKNRRCAWPRGKTLGGSSSINAMFYVRGNKYDYQEWADQGNYGWSYDDVLPYFKKSENYSGDSTEDTRKYHGSNGYLHVENDENMDNLEKLILNAVNELGIPILDDVNAYSQMGVSKSWMTIKEGMRHSTARAFLSPIKHRRNLHVVKNGYVTKLIFIPNTNKVTGVLISKDGKEVIVNAKKEVIVSAGAINTPQLLLLSGIGPSKQLKYLNINVKSDLPVGQNLQDHLFVPFYYTLPGIGNTTTLNNFATEFVRYITTRKGTLSDTSPHRIITFYNTTDNRSSNPDVQFHYLVFPPSLYNVIDILKHHDLSEEIQEKYRKINDVNFIIVVYCTVLQPKSKGKVILKSKDPYEYPLIYANYFDDPEDMTTLINGFKQHVAKLGETNTLKNSGFKLEWLDIDECKEYKKGSYEHLECYCRQMTFSLYHPVSTARMGPIDDKNSVVDPDLRVKNIKNLRVIDASIMPNIVRGNTNAPTIMIGEKGADLIKEFWLPSQYLYELPRSEF